MSLLKENITKSKKLSLRDVNIIGSEKKNNKYRLIAYANKYIDTESMFTKQEIINTIMESSNIEYIRAEQGFKKMLEIGAIKQTLNPEYYYLGSSTPF